MSLRGILWGPRRYLKVSEAFQRVSEGTWSSGEHFRRSQDFQGRPGYILVTSGNLMGIPGDLMGYHEVSEVCQGLQEGFRGLRGYLDVPVVFQGVSGAFRFQWCFRRSQTEDT